MSAVEAPWDAGHEDHRTVLVSRSWGETGECDTCRKVLVAWNDDGRLPYIPAGVVWIPTTPPGQAPAP